MRDAREVVRDCRNTWDMAGAVAIVERDRVSAKLDALIQFAEMAAKTDGADELPEVMLSLMASLRSELEKAGGG